LSCLIALLYNVGLPTFCDVVYIYNNAPLGRVNPVRNSPPIGSSGAFRAGEISNGVNGVVNYFKKDDAYITFLIILL